MQWRIDRDAVVRRTPIDSSGALPGRAARPGTNRQVELLREFEIALVVRGHGHDRAGAVAHQHVVGDPDRDLLVVHRIDRVGAGEDAGLLLRQFGPLEIALARRSARDRLALRLAALRCVIRSTSGCSGASTM